MTTQPGRSAGDRTGTSAQGCPFGSGRCDQSGRHDHDYVVGTYGTRRCTCGSRHYRIITGGPLPAKVLCVRCGRDNYPATCYEAGRAHGPRQRGSSDDDAPF